MNLSPQPSRDRVQASGKPLSSVIGPAFPAILTRAGEAAVFAAEEFFFGKIRNAHIRAAYLRAVKFFLGRGEERGLELVRVTPKDVGQHLDGLKKKNLSVSTRKQHLTAIRHFLDGLVTRHAILLNPALSVRGDRYEVVEGPFEYSVIVPSSETAIVSAPVTLDTFAAVVCLAPLSVSPSAFAFGGGWRIVMEDNTSTFRFFR